MLNLPASTVETSVRPSLAVNQQIGHSDFIIMNYLILFRNRLLMYANMVYPTLVSGRLIFVVSFLTVWNILSESRDEFIMTEMF